MRVMVVASWRAASRSAWALARSQSRCTLVITGLPPLSGFVGKFAMLSALLNPLGLTASAGTQPGAPGWALFVLMIATGLLALIALTRVGIRHFWSTHVRVAPQLRVLEGLPIAVLLALCVALTVMAGPLMQFTQATADALHSPGTYIRAVMQAQPIPGPTTPGNAHLPKEAP